MKLSPLPDDPELIADAIVRMVLISDDSSKVREDVAEIIQQLIEARLALEPTAEHIRKMQEFLDTQKCPG
jgi:hypothetical protein